MSTVVKNVGSMEDHRTNTNVRKAQAETGAVTMTLEGVVFHWGVNESKTMEDRLATTAVANDSRLKIAESTNGGGAARS